MAECFAILKMEEMRTMKEYFLISKKRILKGTKYRTKGENKLLKEIEEGLSKRTIFTNTHKKRKQDIMGHVVYFAFNKIPKIGW